MIMAMASLIRRCFSWAGAAPVICSVFRLSLTRLLGKLADQALTNDKGSHALSPEGVPMSAASIFFPGRIRP